MTYHWDSPPHNPKLRILDTELGRYLVRRSAPRQRSFDILLNGKRTQYHADTMEQAQRMVESIVTAHRSQSLWRVEKSPVPTNLGREFWKLLNPDGQMEGAFRSPGIANQCSAAMNLTTKKQRIAWLVEQQGYRDDD